MFTYLKQNEFSYLLLFVFHFCFLERKLRQGKKKKPHKGLFEVFEENKNIKEKKSKENLKSLR